MGLEAESRPLRESVFGAMPIVTDSKTLTVHLESLDGGAKRERDPFMDNPEHLRDESSKLVPHYEKP